MASEIVGAPGGAAQPLCLAQLLEMVEHVRKGTYCLRLIAEDDDLDVHITHSLDFIAECQERELEVIAAAVRLLSPQ
jgi:hypothetical protein